MQEISSYLPGIVRTINQTLDHRQIHNNNENKRSNTLAFAFANIIIAFGTGEDVLPEELSNFRSLAKEFRPYLEYANSSDHDYSITVFDYQGTDFNQYDMGYLCKTTEEATEYKLSPVEKRFVEHYTNTLIDKIAESAQSFETGFYAFFEETANCIKGINFEKSDCASISFDNTKALPSRKEKIKIIADVADEFGIDYVTDTTIFKRIFKNHADKSEDLSLEF